MIQNKGEFFNSPFFLLSLKPITDTYRNHNNKNKTTIMKQEEEKLTGVPENAFRELKPGEVYNPLMSPDKKYPEVNLGRCCGVSLWQSSFRRRQPIWD